MSFYLVERKKPFRTKNLFEFRLLQIDMYRTASLALFSRRWMMNIPAFASSDASVNLPNPSIAMAPDTNHIVCYHPEKEHPYEYTKPIDRTDASFTQVCLID